MELNTLWFILVGVLFTGFFVLEGFDYGVGILMPLLGKSELERRTILKSIGPVWDGNEVWLLTAGGAIFAAFPKWYATMFSSLYLALTLLLVALILRGLALEYRNKLTSPTWAESLRSRRCVVPISIFYEWKPLPGGTKQAFAFQRGDGDWMWIGGLFEESAEHGLCYATITTEPSAVVSPIHDRMLAVLDFADALRFLRGEDLPFGPYDGPITANPCECPLKRKSPPGGGNPQGDLL